MHLITDIKIIERFLQRDTALHAYGLGDLDEFFRPFTSWYGDHAREPDALILRYEPGNASPVYHALCRKDAADRHATLFRELEATLPDALEVHATPGIIADQQGLFPAFNDFRVERRERHHKMLYRKRPEEVDWDRTARRETTAENIFKFRIAQIVPSELAEVESFFATAYPENWFDPRMLETNAYLLARAPDSTIAGVAGVHVYSEEYRIAALGNIATGPDFRRRGIARQLTLELCRLLRQRRIETIILNVQAENTAAIACYESLGFDICAGYEEFSLRRASS